MGFRGDISFSERAQLEGFVRMANEFDSANELLNKLAKDKKVYGGFCIGVLNNRDKYFCMVSLCRIHTTCLSCFL